MVIENRPGAGGNLGTQTGARANPDGYTILMNSSAFVVNVSLYAKPGYSAADFIPVLQGPTTPNAISVHPSVKAATLQEVIAFAKAKPVSYASSGTGSILHLAGEYFKTDVGGIDVVHVPYRGSGPALQDLLAGNVAWMFETFSTTLQQHRAGKLRVLAYAHAKRAPIAPEIPTMIEAGVPGYEAYTFNLILGPAGLPKEVVGTIDQASRKLMADPTVIKFLEDIAAVPTTDTSPERTAKFIKDEIAKWAPVVRAAGVKIE